MNQSKINSRSKGCRGERELASLLREWGHSAHRGQQYCGYAGDPDIITDIDWLHIEVKRVEKINIDKAMEQAINDCTDKIPCVAHRKNRKDWLITFRLEDILGKEGLLR
jgi:Holliday junction resolvase